MAAYTQLLWTVSGEWTLRRVRFVVQADFTLDGTNFWTVTVRRRRPATASTGAQATGETVGAAYSTEARSLTAGEPVTLYDDAQGLALNDGDLIVATYETTGSPAAMDNPTLLLRRRRNTR